MEAFRRSCSSRLILSESRSETEKVHSGSSFFGFFFFFFFSGVATTRRAGPSADDRRRGAPDIAVWLSKPRGFAALQRRELRLERLQSPAIERLRFGIDLDARLAPLPAQPCPCDAAGICWQDTCRHVARRGDYVERTRTATETACNEAAGGDELLLAYGQLVADKVAAYPEHRKQHKGAANPARLAERQLTEMIKRHPDPDDAALDDLPRGG